MYAASGGVGNVFGTDSRALNRNLDPVQNRRGGPLIGQRDLAFRDYRTPVLVCR
jgi:hypothetical protein